MAGTGVNITDLLNAVQSNNESGVHAFIDAGGDVNITDNEGKTALLYAVQQNNSESVVHALIEKGNCFSNPRDSYGRTPIFYAMDKSRSLINYLLQKKANVHIRDNCNMSILSFFIEHCVTNPQDLYGSDPASYISEIIDLLLQNRVKKNAVFETIMSVVFSKCPLLSYSGINGKTIHVIMELAKTYITEEQELKENKIDDILEMVGKIDDDRQLCGALIPKILDLLFELGADPNSSDSEGNTALHYATCLPFYGVSQDAILDILRKLEEVGVTFNAKNHQNETPLLFCLSLLNDGHQDESSQCSVIKTFVEVCRFLLQNGSNVEDTTRKGDSVFHLILRFLQRLLKWHTNLRFDEVLEEGIKFLDLISERVVKLKSTVIKKRDFKGNSPIHLWASLQYFCEKSVADVKTVFSDFLKKILDNLLRCGAKLHEQNEHGEIPLHLCRTWIAFKLLVEQYFEAGVNLNSVDELGRTPLLAAAKNMKIFHSNQETCFYPDETESKAFWKIALNKGLDPWVVDKHGEFVLSVLMELEDLDLAKALINAFFTNYGLQQSDTIANSILIALCKNKSTDAGWKKDYVKKVLDKIQMPICTMKFKISPLRLCCENIIEASKDLPVERRKTSVHWAIAELLLLYKADCNTPDVTGQSCMDIADSCPHLKDLLTKDFEKTLEQIPNFTKWRAQQCIAKRYKDKLMKVSKFTEHCVQLDKQVWYHRESIKKGSFGCEVFVGINVKDGRELAIKRVEKDQNTNEAQILVKLAGSNEIIQYYSISPRNDGSLYLLFQLMEGDLSEYLSVNLSKPTEERINLCKQLLKGVHHMHGRGIIHRHLKPTNILIARSGDQRRLKIAGFGQSCEADSQPFCEAQYEYGNDSKCWIAPEVLTGEPHSKKSDMFSCGLVLHRIILNTHPYEKGTIKPSSRQNRYNNIESNIRYCKRNEWDKSLTPEMVHMLENVLVKDKEKRSTVEQLLGYPVFWTKDIKIIVLSKFSDEKFEYVHLKELTSRFEAIVNMDIDGRIRKPTKNKLTWDMRKYGRDEMPDILNHVCEEAKKRGIPCTYNVERLSGLLRFIRNAHQHVNDIENERIANLVRNFVFLRYFPNLVVEVFKMIKHFKWDEKRPEIKKAIINLAKSDS